VADCPAGKRIVRGVSEARGLNDPVPRPAIFTRSAYKRAGGFLTSARVDEGLGMGGWGGGIEIVSRGHYKDGTTKPHWEGILPPPAEDTSATPSPSFLNDNSAFSSPLRSSCSQLCNNIRTNQTTTIFDLRLHLLSTPHPSADPRLPAS
jgi:hypothetical protein